MTPIQLCKSIEKATTQVRDLLKKENIMSDYGYFDYRKFKSNGFDKKLKRVCKTNKVSPNQVKRILKIDI